MWSSMMTRVCLLTLAAASLWAQSYSVLVLKPAAGMPAGTSVRAWAMNNRSQVLGEQTVPGLPQLFPVVWTRGLGATLQMPAGFLYSPLDSGWQINDDGVVLGFVVSSDDPNPSHGRVALIKGKESTVLPHGPSSCGTTVRSAGLGINKAGHVIGESRDQWGCGGYWYWDGAAFTVLPLPPVPQPPAGCTSSSAFPHPTFTGALNPINDADEIAVTVEVDNWYCPDPVAYFPAVYKPGTGYTYLPLPDGALSAYAASRNNRSTTLGWFVAAEVSRAVAWNKNGLIDLGPTAYASLNDLNQILYRSNTGVLGIWRNGTTDPVVLPAEVDPAAQLTLFNNLGQIAGRDLTLGSILLTPNRGCPADVTSQVSVQVDGWQVDAVTGRAAQQVKITNQGTASLAAPLSLVFDDLSSTASLVGAAGVTVCGATGSPYVQTRRTLAPGDSDVVRVLFTSPSKGAVTYSLRVLAAAEGENR